MYREDLDKDLDKREEEETIEMSMEIWLCSADTSCENCLSMKCLDSDQGSFTLGAETVQREDGAVSPGWHLLSPLGCLHLHLNIPIPHFLG